MSDRPPTSNQEAAECSLISAMAVNALVSMDRSQILAATGRLAARAAMDPGLLARRGLGLARELVEIVIGRSERRPEPGDKRFGDPAFDRHPGYRRVMQSYLAIRAALHTLVDQVDLDPKSRDRARFALSLLTEALAPTNTLLGNPAAIKRAFDTAGVSLAAGLKNLVTDYVENNGMPSQVDRRPFKVGENLAVTPGQVVFRNEVLELIQYAPSTPEVYERPFLFIPPQVRTLCLRHRSRPELHGVRREGWVHHVRRELAKPDTGAARLGARLLRHRTHRGERCGRRDHGRGEDQRDGAAGGITTAVLLAHLAARGDDRFSSATFPVTMIDMGDPGTIGIFTSEASIASSSSPLRGEGDPRARISRASSRGSARTTWSGTIGSTTT